MLAQVLMVPVLMAQVLIQAILFTLSSSQLMTLVHHPWVLALQS